MTIKDTINLVKVYYPNIKWDEYIEANLDKKLRRTLIKLGIKKVGKSYDLNKEFAERLILLDLHDYLSSLQEKALSVHKENTHDYYLPVFDLVLEEKDSSEQNITGLHKGIFRTFVQIEHKERICSEITEIIALVDHKYSNFQSEAIFNLFYKFRKEEYETDYNRLIEIQNGVKTTKNITNLEKDLRVLTNKLINPIDNYCTLRPQWKKLMSD
ncbi:MAG: hypothetical protein MJ172_07055 [Clostridia bacterium]|nr:hypothetical protein [Clostridia bacterium]